MAGTPTQANRALAILSSLMAWVSRYRLREGNPCHGVSRFKEREVNRYPTSAQLIRITEVINELVEQRTLNLFLCLEL